jgi:GTP-binding protein YchF
MGFNLGIVGLPNVGKSTLFNALTSTAAAQTANFPFCTIEPNVGRIAVPDPRLDRIAAIAKSQKVTPTQLEFVDIAGLVKGASGGEGLGNKFLSHIREVDAIIHLVRCFTDEGVSHVSGRIDPLDDVEVIETELLVADLESLERRVPSLVKKAKGGDREAKDILPLMERVLAGLREGHPARETEVSDDERKAFRGLQLLTSKPLLYVCNVEEDAAATGNALSAAVAARAAETGAETAVISARIEAEVAELGDPAEREAYLESLGLEETGLAKVIHAGYRLLDQITFFTAGPKESRAWTVRRGAKAPEAAGAIHTDFERGFIRAETIAYDDFVTLGGEHAAKEAGRMRSEGRDYEVKDGDILLFRFNV